MKKICITGATSGIGESCVRRFAKEDNIILAIGRNKKKLSQLQEEFPKKIIPIEADVRDQNHLKEVLSPHKDVDILINNAGLALGLGPAYEGLFEDWNIVVDTNIKALLGITHIFLPDMVQRNDGLIINIGSIAATYPYPGGNVYAATKAFVHQFSLSLRSDLFGTKVRVSCIEPGLVKTNFSEVRFKGDHEKAEQLYEGIAYLTPDDIAESVFWVSKLPPHVNINMLEIMPQSQTFSMFAFDRSTRKD